MHEQIVIWKKNETTKPYKYVQRKWKKIKYMYSKNLDLHLITGENYNFYRLN